MRRRWPGAGRGSPRPRRPATAAAPPAAAGAPDRPAAQPPPPARRPPAPAAHGAPDGRQAATRRENGWSGALGDPPPCKGPAPATAPRRQHHHAPCFHLGRARQMSPRPSAAAAVRSRRAERCSSAPAGRDRPGRRSPSAACDRPPGPGRDLPPSAQATSRTLHDQRRRARRDQRRRDPKGQHARLLAETRVRGEGLARRRSPSGVQPPGSSPEGGEHHDRRGEPGLTPALQPSCRPRRAR